MNRISGMLPILLVFAPVAFVSHWLVNDAHAQTRESVLRKVTTFDLPGPGGKRFDYLTIDGDDHYLISAHLAAGQTYVIDLRTNKVVATVTDTPGVEGVEYVPDGKKYYTSNAGDNTIGVVDLRRKRVMKKKLTTEKKARWQHLRRTFSQTLCLR